MALGKIVGRLLSWAHAGEGSLLMREKGIDGAPATIQVSSVAFAEGHAMPARYSRRGGDVFPPLSWNGVPPDAASVALVVEDSDAPLPEHPFVHCIVYNIAPSTRGLREGEIVDQTGRAAKPGSGSWRVGRNSFGKDAWMGPDPIPGHGPHHYTFQLFALDRTLSIEGTVTRAKLLEAMHGHVIAVGALTGTYERE